MAKLISGSKYWLIGLSADAGEALFDLSTFDLLYDFRTKGAKRRSSGNNALESHLQYHVAQPLDLIIQPSFAVHEVITEPTFSRGKPTWALEGEGTRGHTTSIRGRRVIIDFCLDIRKGVIAKEICVHSEFELLRLLKTADYRKAVARCKDGSDMPLSIPEANVTTHIKILLRAGYDLKQSLSEMKKKKVKKYNFPTSSSADNQYISR